MQISHRRFTVAAIRPLLCLASIFWSLAASVAVAGEQARTGAAALRSKGLTRSGVFWICRGESRLKQHLDSLPALDDAIGEQTRDLDSAVERNAQLWKQRTALEQRLRTLQAARKRTAGGSQQRKQLDEQIKRQRDFLKPLREVSVQPELVGETPRFHKRIIDLINDRNRLALALLAIRRQCAALPQQYTRLRRDAEVIDSLAALGNGHKLGPAKDYQQGEKKLNRYEELVFTAVLPLYRQSGRLRVPAIINEQLPATFSWNASSEPTLITANMVQAWGIEIPSDAKRLEHSLAANRKVTVRRVTIPSVRLGKFVLHDVAALALPPEAEDVGAQIGRAALPGFNVSAEPARLRLTIEPLN